MLVSDDVLVLTCSHHIFLMLILKQLVKSLAKYFEPSTFLINLAASLLHSMCATAITESGKK